MTEHGITVDMEHSDGMVPVCSCGWRGKAHASYPSMWAEVGEHQRGGVDIPSRPGLKIPRATRIKKYPTIGPTGPDRPGSTYDPNS